MLTSSEIREKQFKNGIGYDKKDVEQFLHDISNDFEALYKENSNLKNKAQELDDNLGYYKTIEKTLQKALMLAEKTAQDTRATAFREADAIEMEAKAKANMILSVSRKQLEVLEHKTINLMQQYDLFKAHFEGLLHSEIELLNSKSFSINSENFTYHETEHNTQEFGSLSDEEFQKAINAIEENGDLALLAHEDRNQLRFDLYKDEVEVKNEKTVKTEDGFEFL